MASTRSQVQIPPALAQAIERGAGRRAVMAVHRLLQQAAMEPERHSGSASDGANAAATQEDTHAQWRGLDQRIGALETAVHETEMEVDGQPVTLPSLPDTVANLAGTTEALATALGLDMAKGTGNFEARENGVYTIAIGGEDDSDNNIVITDPEGNIEVSPALHLSTVGYSAKIAGTHSFVVENGVGKTVVIKDTASEESVRIESLPPLTTFEQRLMDRLVMAVSGVLEGAIAASSERIAALEQKVGELRAALADGMYTATALATLLVKTGQVDKDALNNEMQRLKEAAGTDGTKT